jgi:O-antigen ligase
VTKRVAWYTWMLLGLGLTVLLAAGAVLIWPKGTTSVQGELPFIPLAVDKSLGVNTDLSRLYGAERQMVLAQIEEAGFRWVRQPFPWDAIEPARGEFDWAIWDEIVSDVAKHGLQLIAVLNASPAWARSAADAENPLAPPVETRDFGDFAEAFAARYGGQIDSYQIWDEPNIAPHWGAREIDPAAYARLLREGAIRVRAADSGAVVLLAALAPNVEPGGANMSEVRFLDALYQHGAAEWFDVVAAQPYGFEEPMSMAPDPNRLNWERVALLRSVMQAHDDTATAIWAVSFGLTEPTSQAVQGALQQARQDWPWLGPMLWAAWSPEDSHGQYALTDAEGQPGPAYGALQHWAMSPVLAWPGAYPSDHASGRFEGDWRVTASGADIGKSGDHLAIPFQGTRLDLRVRRGDYRAFLFVTVDGQPANALPRDNQGRSYVVLYDPLLQVDTVTLARNLPDGDHLAEIVADRGWGQWAIIGWAASREAPTKASQRLALWLPLSLGLAATAVLGATVYRTWPHRQALLGTVYLWSMRYRALDDRVALILTAVAVLVVYIMVGTVPTLIALLLLSVLLLLRPEMGPPLIVLALPFYQLGRPLLGKVFSMVEILTLLTAVGWLARWGAGKVGLVIGHPSGDLGTDDAQATSRSTIRPRANILPRLAALDWGVLALVLVGALSLLWAEYGRVASREFRTVVLEAALFYCLLRAMLPGQRGTPQEQRELWRVIDAWVLGGLAIALVGIYQWAFGQNLITAEGVWRVRGFYGSPNNLALYLGRILPLTIAMAAWGARGRRRWVYGLAAVVISAALFLTYSRGAWLVGVPASLLFLAAMRGRRAFAVALVVFILLAVVVVGVVGAGRLTSLLDTGEGTTFFRLQLWQSSWAMIREHPFLGVGLDNFLYHYRTYYVLPTAWEEFNLSHPHNLVLDFWLRLGLPGLLVLFWLLFAFFRRAGQVYRKLPAGGEKLLALGLMAGMVNFVAHGLVDNAFFLVDLAFVFMLMLAAIQALGDEGSANSTQWPGLASNV